MNQLCVDEQPINRNPACSDQTMAERELAAFFSAVTELFGPEQAVLSAEDWLHELVARNCLPTSTRDWRRITVEASAQHASRANARAKALI
jgi:hypothetical protein